MDKWKHEWMERWVDVRIARVWMAAPVSRVRSPSLTLFERRMEGRSEVEALAPVRACPEFGLGRTLACMGTWMVMGWSALSAVDILLACTDVVAIGAFVCVNDLY